MKLYELPAQIGRLAELAEDNGQEFVADTLESLQMEFEEKARNIVALSACMDSDVEAIDAEIKRLTARKKTIQARQEWVKSYLIDNMEKSGISKISCPLFSITLRKPAKAVLIEDESLLPDDCVSVVTTIKPDKKEIAKKLKEGVDVPGAKLVDGKASLLIK